MEVEADLVETFDEGEVGGAVGGISFVVISDEDVRGEVPGWMVVVWKGRIDAEGLCGMVVVEVSGVIGGVLTEEVDDPRHCVAGVVIYSLRGGGGSLNILEKVMSKCNAVRLKAVVWQMLESECMMDA